jgi:MFS family permease
MVCWLCAWSVQSLRAGLDDDRDPTVKPSLVTTVVQPLKLIFEHRSLKVLSFMSFLFAICQMSLMAYLVTFLFEDLCWSLVAAGVALTVTQAAGVGGRIFWGYVSDRWLGAVMMLIVITVLLALGAVGMAFLQADTSSWLLFSILIVFGASAIGWNGVYLAEIARQAPKGQAGVATGGTLCITFLGVMLGPPFFGLVAGTVHSYGLSYGLLLIPALIIFVLLIRLRSGPAQ